MKRMGQEYLTIEQFAERMQISRSTAYGWLTGGQLETGRHVLRIGHVVRILWNEDLVRHLMQQSIAGAETIRPTLTRKGKGGRNCCALDPLYLQTD